MSLPHLFFSKGICAPNGLLLSASCSGCNYTGTYANGACGTYTSVIEANSCTYCGCCCPAYGTYLSSGCEDWNSCAVRYDYADGNCGYYSEYNYYECTSGGMWEYTWCDGCQCMVHNCDGSDSTWSDCGCC